MPLTVAPTYISDSSGVIWKIGCSNVALITTTQVTGIATAVQGILLLDTSSVGQVWSLTVTTEGFPQVTAATGAARKKILVNSPNGSLYQIQIWNGLLQTAIGWALGGGPFIDAAGNPISNGTLLMQLPQDAVTTSGQVVGAIMLYIPLDVNGNVENPAPVFPTTSLSPNIEYNCWVQTNQGAQVWGPHKETVSNGAFNIAQNWTISLP